MVPFLRFLSILLARKVINFGFIGIWEGGGGCMVTRKKNVLKLNSGMDGESTWSGTTQGEKAKAPDTDILVPILTRNTLDTL